MRARIFQYAVLLHPTDEQYDKGVRSKMIVEPTLILSTDQNSANMAAVMAIPSEYKEQLDQIEVALRPF